VRLPSPLSFPGGCYDLSRFVSSCLLALISIDLISIQVALWLNLAQDYPEGTRPWATKPPKTCDALYTRTRTHTRTMKVQVVLLAGGKEVSRRVSHPC